MNWTEAILGSYSIATWGASFIWSLVGITLVKVYHYNSKKNFSLTYWLSDNLQDTILGVMSIPLILRLGDIGSQLLVQYLDFKPLVTLNSDMVPYVVGVSIYLQNKLHKNRKTKSIQR